MLLLLLACAERAPCDLRVAPDSIDEALDVIEQLPSPVELNCFLEALERPLGIELTSDVNSAQPAEGRQSPRIFVRGENLTLSVVPVGEASRLLEFGEMTTSGLTVKAELAFPIDLSDFDRQEAFDGVLANETADFTGCGVCHVEEEAIGDGRYASTPLRPPDSLLVPLETLLPEHEDCDVADDPDRCAMFSALFDHGEVFIDPFPDSFPTLTEPAF